ncbi:pyrimidine/purine nucleoside phosphorylase [Siansivirga zeaxanthinifaciens]|uniref:Pyrimidine/purine nucleoside phosphorylase n=1 Tax=Siansivirga zeaxanthinifaciens CC-SAMT-1 TaxID=1454006 RepID=A0A0C5W9F6_9FLAO|nr:pyrimidine/purine nucleoside phosphorylase [Siansivirga zeaxanthinifaciens]AJR02942.1 hypothetical protein AW14_04095 [Siansivirga zeaxanthinifaciens CC-SAMT-1]
MISTNEYFEGNVKSLGYVTASGKSTLGVMNPGDYEFGTSQHETMRVIEGEMTVKLPESNDWNTFKAGDTFEVDANKSFLVKVSVQTSYLCQYK